MVSTPPPLTHLTCVCVYVCVCVFTGFPAPDLSPIISLVLLFTSSLIPLCLLSLFLCLYPSAPYYGGNSVCPEVGLGLPFCEEAEGRSYRG